MVARKDAFKRFRYPLLAGICLNELAMTHFAQDAKAHILLGDDAEFLRAFKNDAFLARDSVLVTEELDMRGADVCNERAVGFCDVAEVGYLAGVVRAHFENEEVGVFRAVEDGDWKPDVVVEVPVSRMDFADGREERLYELLRGGLAGRACDGDDLGLERAAIFPRHAVEFVIAVDNPRRALLERLRNVVVTICLLALQRDKEHPRLHLARIKRRPGEYCSAHHSSSNWSFGRQIFGRRLFSR